MTSSIRLPLLAVAVLLATCVPPLAQDKTSGAWSSGMLDVVDEVRFGANYHMVHWTMLPVEQHAWNLTRLEDISFDVLFTSPDLDAFRWIGAPRPEIGATVSLAGRDSLVHLGLTWQVPIFDTPIYLEGTLGGALNNGYLTNAPDGRRNFGCRVNFYERFGIGSRLGDNATITLTYEHTSNAELCEANDGLSNLGLRLGWKF